MSQQQCDVSIVVSTCNRADLLVHCVRSLVESRTPVSFEIIVVDNGSTDGTREAIEGFLEDGAVPLQYVWEPRRGVSYGRNAGIERAVGRIIAFTDDDIQVSPDWVTQIHQLFEHHPDIDCIGGPVLPLWAEPPPSWLDSRHWSPLSVTDHGAVPFEIDADRPLCLLTSNLAFRRGVFDRIGVFSPEFPRAQDHDLQLRFWLSGGRALYSPAVVVHTAVPRERLRLRYHRRWHVRHGRMCARMRLRQLTAPDGSLRVSVLRERVVLGAAAFLWRELGRAALDWMVSLPRRDQGRRLENEMRVRHLVGYILEQPSLRRHVSLTNRAALAATGMSSGRVAMVTLLALGIMAGSAFDVVKDREHWPFSPYPMFATVDRSHDHRTLRLYGVVRDSGQELALTDFAYLEPFDQCRLSTALARLAGNPVTKERVPAAVEDVYTRYERRRAAGRHRGPRLQSLRLYQLRWVLEPHARNALHPDSRELLYERR